MNCPKCNQQIIGQPIQCPKCGKILATEGIKMIQRDYQYMDKKGIDAYKFMWKKIIDFLGRTTRTEFFHAVLIHGAILLILQFLLQPMFIFISGSFQFPGLLNTFQFLKNTIFIVSAIPVYNILLRRVRDAGLNPIFGFTIAVFIFIIGFLSIIIGNVSSSHESIRGIIENPYPYLPFLFRSNSQLTHTDLVFGFLRFITAVTVILLQINLLLVFIFSFFPTKKET
jgi:uncharacterized membrane protein YhaH (DUF805 family)